MVGKLFCSAGNMLFHVRVSFRPPPNPGILMSDSMMYVLPLERLIGCPPASRLQPGQVSAAVLGETHPRVGAMQVSPKGIPPGLQHTDPTGSPHIGPENPSQTRVWQEAGKVGSGQE